MTAILGRDEFAAARLIQAEDARQAAAAERDRALGALLEARADFAADAQVVHDAGANLAGRDSDRLEEIAGRILAAVDDLEGLFERLDLARDIASAPHQRRRSSWARAEIAHGLAEALYPLLSPGGCAVLSAAVGLEACV